MCCRCVRTSVGTRVPGKCSGYERTAVGSYLQQLVVFSSIYVRASTVGKCSKYISRCSTCIQHVRAVGTYLFCSITFFFNIYIYVRTSAVQFARMSVRSTYWTAVGIVRARAVGSVGGTVGMYMHQ